jgi:hypothetical protein
MPISFLRLAALAVLLSGFAWAAPVTYTESIIATGAIGFDDFTNALLTLTFSGDTANVAPVVNVHGVFSNPVGIAQVEIPGLTATLRDPTVVFVNNSTGVAGFEDMTAHIDLIDTDNSVFGGYGLTTAIGPILGTSGTATTEFAFPTTDLDQGDLTIRSTTGVPTFTATLAPEPAVLCLVGLGLIAGVAVRRRFNIY